MVNKELLEKYAKLVVKTGVNVSENQGVVISASPNDFEFVRIVTEECYKNGAAFVNVEYADQYVSRLGLLHQSDEQLMEVPEHLIQKRRYYIDKNVCFIHIMSPIPGVNKGVDPKKLQLVQMAVSKKLEFERDHRMKNVTQWSIIATPNKVWAKQVFKDLDEDKAVEKLWEAILLASRVTPNTDPIENWNNHIKNLERYNDLLNNYDFKSLHFENSLGTNLNVELVPNHIWAGGAEYTSDSKVFYAPNIPTEEVFTMPYKYGVNGVVVSTKDLNYQGKVIKDFSLTFKDGKVVSFTAKEEYETLKNLINFDEGSSYLGEVALISDNSPISNMNINFINTLFDENASCHLALGSSYSMNVKDGVNMSKEELEKIGANNSNTHVDFMFGSKCMNITGLTKDNKEVVIFKDGNFVI